MNPLADCGFRDAEAFLKSAYSKSGPDRSNYVSLCVFSIVCIGFSHAHYTADYFVILDMGHENTLT